MRTRPRRRVDDVPATVLHASFLPFRSLPLPHMLPLPSRAPSPLAPLGAPVASFAAVAAGPIGEQVAREPGREREPARETLREPGREPGREPARSWFPTDQLFVAASDGGRTRELLAAVDSQARLLDELLAACAVGAATVPPALLRAVQLSAVALAAVHGDPATPA
jgi:hypothetical protein